MNGLMQLGTVLQQTYLGGDTSLTYPKIQTQIIDTKESHGILLWASLHQ